MKYQKHTLPNKVTVLIVPMKSTEAITMLAMIKSGSRNESEIEKGLAHFCEHMVFKGGKQFKNSQEIAGAIDNVGGDLNAYTGEETTAYYVKVAKEFLVLGLDVLADLVINPRFPSNELEKEKGVIVEEINMYEDMPKSKAQLELASILFPDHPLGWSIAGTKQTVTSFSRDNFKRYHQKMYCGQNLIVILAGAVKENDLKKVSQRFSSLKAGEKTEVTPPSESQSTPNLKMTKRLSEQTHLAFGLRSIKLSDQRRFVHKLLSIIIGGSMSSRLFVNLREKQGLCYYVHASTESHTDAGHFDVAAGVDNQRVQIAIESILKELNLIRDRGITASELEKAKQLMIGRMKLSLEDSEQVAEYFVVQEVLENQVQTPEQVIEKIKAVTKQEVKDLAQNIFQPKNLNLSLVGPKQDKDQIMTLLAKF